VIPNFWTVVYIFLIFDGWIKCTNDNGEWSVESIYHLYLPRMTSFGPKRSSSLRKLNMVTYKNKKSTYGFEVKRMVILRSITHSRDVTCPLTQSSFECFRLSLHQFVASGLQMVLFYFFASLKLMTSFFKAFTYGGTPIWWLVWNRSPHCLFPPSQASNVIVTVPAETQITS